MAGVLDAAQQAELDRMAGVRERAFGRHVVPTIGGAASTPIARGFGKLPGNAGPAFVVSFPGIPIPVRPLLKGMPTEALRNLYDEVTKEISSRGDKL